MRVLLANPETKKQIMAAIEKKVPHLNTSDFANRDFVRIPSDCYEIWASHYGDQTIMVAFWADGINVTVKVQAW